MSLNKLSLIKLKRQCQETLFNSIEKELDINNSQSYIPAFSSTVEIQNNEFSKKLFVFNSKNILLGFNESEGETEKQPISQLLQGKINANIINKQIYTQSNNYNSYKNYIVTKDIFIKSNPILDVIKYMEGNYQTNIETPSIFSYKTNNKINNINNNAYIEPICSYYLNLLTEKKLTSLFPEFYGSFNGISKKYLHDISEDYEYIKDKDWFIKNNIKLFEIIKEDNLSGFEDFNFGNMKKIDYNEEITNNTVFNNLEVDLKTLEIDELTLDLIIEKENSNNKSEDNKKSSNNTENYSKIDIEQESKIDIEQENKIDIEQESKSDSDSDSVRDSDSDSVRDSDSDSVRDNDSTSSIDSLMSSQSCILSEVYSKLKSIPVQILAMELMGETLTNLIKNDLGKNEWKSILFQICFGLSVAQKHFKFIHNDLHTDNIMFKKITEEYKYFMYKNKYFRVPTFNKETKVIDFARGILCVGNNTYFSDVFKNDGDAGGQYNYMKYKCCIKKNKSYNYNFDLARLGTTIINYLDDYELSSFVNSWTIGKNGKDFTKMDDDFSLYVEISRHSNDCLPKNQLLRDFFKEYIINKEEIPENSHVYIY